MLVHFGWIGGDVPATARASADAVAKAFPSCQVMLHEGDGVLPARWRDAIASARLPPRMLSDIQRHAILRRYGGLWLDLDVAVVADPVEWTGTFDRYTAVHMGDAGRFIGTDIIYAPVDWAGWDAVEGYIDRFLLDRPARISVLHVASRMIERLSAVRPEDFAILRPGTVFPMSPAAFSAASVVARGFRPLAAQSATPRRPGLGDMVADGLARIGITKERVQSVASRVGLKDCGCSKRQAALNRAGEMFGLPPGRYA